MKDLQPATALWEMYRPQEAKYRFRARTLTEARRWQRTARRRLSRLVGFQDDPPVALRPRMLERVDKGDYIRQKVLLQTARHTVMGVYILIPKHRPHPLPTVLAFHGHGYGVKAIVGLAEDGAERDTPEGYQADFAVALCRRGFLVAAPEISCFGERQTDFSYLGKLNSPVPQTCWHTSWLAMHMGGTAIGMRVRDAKRLVDYLRTRPDADARRHGAMGISGGGLHTFFSTCLDTRIRACVVSGYFCTFRDSILAMHHCHCNYVPNLGQFGEIYDRAGLIAPRPMLVESGHDDEIFPRFGVRKAVARARSVYGVFGRGRYPLTDYFKGYHQISGRKAYDFLAEILGAQEA